VTRAGLAGTGLVEGAWEQSCCVTTGTWGPGVLRWDCLEDAQTTPNPVCRERVIARVTYAPRLESMCMPTPSIQAGYSAVDAPLQCTPAARTLLPPVMALPIAGALTRGESGVKSAADDGGKNC